MKESKNVLVVDDCHTDARLFEALLELDGYAVHVANDAHEALVIASEQVLDLALVDLQLPDMDGLQLACELKQRALPRVVPVMAVSASDRLQDCAEARAVGIDWFLRKPVSTASLRTMIALLIEERASERR